MPSSSLISLYLSAKNADDKNAVAEILAMVPENQPGPNPSFTLPLPSTSRTVLCRCPQCLVVPPHRRARYEVPTKGSI